MGLNTREVTWIVNVHAYNTISFSTHSYACNHCFVGTHLEELKGEIWQLCKDQHRCHYLQIKLEESVPEHHDMIFHETFSHFADLMAGMYLLVITV